MSEQWEIYETYREHQRKLQRRQKTWKFLMALAVVAAAFYIGTIMG